MVGDPRFHTKQDMRLVPVAVLSRRVEGVQNAQNEDQGKRKKALQNHRHW